MSNLRLSEAMRLGAMLHPQAFGGFFDDEGGTCAWGAAYKALGIPIPAQHGPHDLQMLDLFGDTFRRGAPCPSCGELLVDVIVHLNDTHRWTRERIADYVESIERERELIAEPAIEETVPA